LPGRKHDDRAAGKTTTTAAAVRCFAGWQNGTAAGERLIKLLASGSNRVSFRVRNDAGTSFDASFDLLTAGTVYHLAGVLDTAAAKVRLYVNGALASEVAVTGTFTTALNAFVVGRRPDSATEFLAGEIDEARVWNTARTATEIVDNKDRELEGTESGLVQYWPFNEGAGGSAGNEIGGGVALTVTGATWIGSLEGDESIAGKPKPRAVGLRRQVAPILVDPQNLVYQFNDGSMQSVLALRDSGEDITFGSDLADIYSAAPTAGTYNSCLAKGLVRLGSAPVGVITGDIEGDNAGTNGHQETVAGIGRKVLEQWGGLSEFDSLAFAALELLDDSVHGFFWDGEVNVDAAVDEVFRSGWSWWGPNRVGEITCGRIVDPTGQSATVTVGEGDLVDPSRGGTWQSDPFSVRVGEVRVLFRPYHRTLNEDQVAGSVDLATAHDFGQPYRVARAVNADASDDADVVEIITSIDDRAAAQALADAILAMLQTDRELLRISLSSGILSYYIGTIIRLVLSRYSLDSGKQYAVVALSELYGEAGTPDRVEVTLFG
jgi:hypothetical protein